MPGSFKIRVMIVAGMLALGLAPCRMLGQSQTSAALTGKVTDQAGGALPSVKVTVTSPALQVPQLTTTTDANGDYQFLGLPAPGVFSVSFELSGFQTYVQTSIHLGVGFTGKVDASMKVGSVNQSVEVRGENPVVDTVSSSPSATLQLQEIQATPKGLGVQELLPMAAGLTLAGPPDVGDSNLANRKEIVTYGVALTPTLDIEGVDTSTNKDLNSSVYLDTLAIQEAQFKTTGNNADVPFPGVDQELVMKSGSNTFHGTVQGDFENPSFQGNNITAALAGPPNNLKFGNPLENSGYFDYAADLGGRIITDKLWFYGGYSLQQVTQGQVGFVGAPDSAGCWTCAGTKAANILTSLKEYNYKLSYQIKPSTTLLFSDMHGTKVFSDQGASPFRPLPAGMYEVQPGSMWHAEVQSAPSPRLVIDALFGHGGYQVNYTPESASEIGQFGFTKGSDFPGSPSEEELTNSLFTGPSSSIQNRPDNRYEMKATATFIPAKPHLGGTHEIKFGSEADWEIGGTRVLKDSPSGDYLLQFQNGVPNKIVVYNFPFATSTDHLYRQAGFLMDTWRIRRVSLNLGVRGERFNSFYPSQSKQAGQFSGIFPAENFSGQSILVWTDVVPRAGATWDVKGDGKTVVSGSFGIFGDTMGVLFANTFNPNAQRTNTYNWSGPCGPTDPLAPIEYPCDVTPAFLATLPSRTPIATTGGTSQIRNPNLKQDQTYEYTARLERQIMPNMAFDATYVHYNIYNMYNAATNAGVVSPTASFVNNGINVGHPYNTWTIPVVFTDTFNGTSTPVTVYTYPKGSGNTTNEVVNTPSSRPDIYDSFEFGVTKRYSNRWNGLASFWATKDHRWLQGTAGITGSPNDDAFPIDNTWGWQARGDLTYNLPRGFQIFSFYRAQSGTPGQRVSVFNSPALIQGPTTVRMGPFGQYRGPVVSLLNAKIAKTFTVHDRYHFEANFETFNVLNSSGAVATNYQTGPTTFGKVTSIISPRVARIGGVFTF